MKYSSLEDIVVSALVAGVRAEEKADTPYLNFLNRKVIRILSERHGFDWNP